MESILHFFGNIDAWLRQYILMIAMAQVATILVIFGNKINALVKVLVSPYPFFVRISAFIALCTFGYGALTAYTTPLYAGILKSLNSTMLLPVVLITFIVIGIVTERGIKLLKVSV